MGSNRGLLYKKEQENYKILYMIKHYDKSRVDIPNYGGG